MLGVIRFYRNRGIAFLVGQVDRAGDAGVEGMDGAQDLQRLLGIGDRGVEQRGLVGAGLVLLVARAGVPGRGHDALVILDLAVVDDHPVRQRAARRLVETHAHDFVLGELGRVEGLGVALADILDQRGPLPGQHVDLHRGRHGARGMAADGRVHGIEADLGLGQRRDGVERGGGVFLGRLVAGGEHVEHARQGADLGHLAVEGRRLEPGILGVVLEVRVVGLGLALVGMQRAALGIVVPGMLDRLLDALGEILVAEGLDRLVAGKVAALDEAAGHGELRALGVHRNVGHGQVVGDALADRRPVGIEGADGGDVDQVDVLDEVGKLVDETLDRHQALDGEHGLRIGGDRVGHAADGHILDVRGLGAEDGDDLVGLALHFQRLQVVCHGHQVHLGRELHRRVAPVAVGENAELPAIDEMLEPLMHAAHLVLAVEVPGREAFAQRSGLVRIGLQRRGDIDPIERRQLVEMHDVIVNAVRQPRSYCGCTGH
jgi:hypothetical protein